MFSQIFQPFVKTAAKRIAFQVVRTSFLGPRPCCSPPPPKNTLEKAGKINTNRQNEINKANKSKFAWDKFLKTRPWVVKLKLNQEVRTHRCKLEKNNLKLKQTRR